MSIVTLHWDQPPPPNLRHGAVAMGNFDGVHLGHAALMAELRRQANAHGGPAVAMTFDPHPLQLLRPEQFQPVLTTVLDRAELLQAAGADHVILLQTTRALLQISAVDFFHGLLRQQLAARAIVEGQNFGFGRNRQGTITVLTDLCAQSGIDLMVVPPVLWSGKPVSSSRVRNALLDGNVREAATLLQRPYRLHGTVGIGQQRGRTLGFPTANLHELRTLVPGNGVYVVRVRHQDKHWPGAANIGPNPTFGEQARKVEVHLIGFAGDLVGQELGVDFLERLRDTRPFSGVAELVEQLRQDVERAHALEGSLP
jgi:riboflavin kinase/FMN adenylyltransferase